MSPKLDSRASNGVRAAGCLRHFKPLDRAARRGGEAQNVGAHVNATAARPAKASRLAWTAAAVALARAAV